MDVFDLSQFLKGRECFLKWFHNNKEETWNFFWIDFTSILSILQKSKVANNLITILSYSNDKNIYIAKNIISID